MRPKTFVITFTTYDYTIDIPTMGSQETTCASCLRNS